MANLAKINYFITLVSFCGVVFCRPEYYDTEYIQEYDTTDDFEEEQKMPQQTTKPPVISSEMFE